MAEARWLYLMGYADPPLGPIVRSESSEGFRWLR
jgi:hypothetical protein